MTSSHSAANEPLSVGDLVLDRYRVVERLEEGGTSVVYRGEDERLSRPVCIKVFQSLRDKEWTHQTTYEHFVQEAFALSRLTHPNTLRIYDFAHLVEDDDSDGPPFQVSEYMNGGTLSGLVRTEGPFSRSATMSVVQAICGALDEAHDHGIVHRDIKPKNILYGTSGQTRAPKLADFGIAKSLSPESGLVNQAGDTRVVSGRRLLMFSGLWAAPEQLAGEPVSPVTDIYSFALVTLYMLTGQNPFSVSAPREALLERAQAARLIDDIVGDGNVPPSVVSVLKRACSLDPEARPARAGEFAELLAEAFDNPQAVTARRRLPLEAPGHLTPVPDPGPQSSEESTAPVGRRPSPPQPPRRLTLAEGPQLVGNRTAALVALGRNAAADLNCLGGRARLRVSLVPCKGGFTLHVRGLSCFVRKVGGRPTRAVTLTGSSTVELVAPDQQLIAVVSVDFGKPAAGHTVFEVGDLSIAIGTDDCPTVIGFDFGPGHEALFACLANQSTQTSDTVSPLSKGRL